MSQPIITIVPAITIYAARCPICDQTNNAIIENGASKLTRAKCSHAIGVSQDPPSITFTELE